jgi:glycerol-3-phosphate dehydrogenase
MTSTHHADNEAADVIIVGGGLMGASARSSCANVAVR